MNWEEFMIHDARYKRFDVEDASRTGDKLKSYLADESIPKDDVGLNRTFETMIGGNVNLYVKVYSSGVASTSSVERSYMLSVYDKDDNVVVQETLTTKGKGSANTTLTLSVGALGKYTINVNRVNHDTGAEVSDMILFGKVVDNSNLYIF